MKLFPLIASAAAVFSTAISAQPVSWPSDKPVRIVVPYAAGGTADTLGRQLASQLQASLKQNFLVENRTGGGGLIGARFVSQSAPDGYTLAVSGGGSHVISPLLAGKGLETLSESTPIAMIGGLPSVLLVNPSSGVRSISELVVKVQGMPDGLTWGSPGAGTSSHLAGEILFQARKVKHTHIPYQGGTPALQNLMGNHILAAIVNLPAVVPHIKSGRVIALAVTSEVRVSGVPEVPSFGEEGLPNCDTWYGIAGPAAMPGPLVERINAEVRRALNTESLQKRLAVEYVQPRDMDVQGFSRHVRIEFERWMPHVQMLNAKAKQ